MKNPPANGEGVSKAVGRVLAESPAGLVGQNGGHDADGDAANDGQVERGNQNDGAQQHGAEDACRERHSADLGVTMGQA